MNINIALLIFVIEFSVYILIGISSMGRYLRYRYLADLNLSIAFILGIVMAIQRYYITFLDDTALITLIYRFLNLFVMIQIFFIYTAFTLYYKNRYSSSITVFAFITGILAGSFLYDPSFRVAYDAATGSYNGVYASSLLIFILPLIVFSFVRMLQPVFRKLGKIDNQRDRQQLLIMIAGIIMILSWGVGAALTSIASFRMIRPLLFSTGWLIWYISSRRNPFFLSISNAIPKSLYVSNSSGHLFYNYDFEDQKNIAPEMVSALVSAINSFANELFKIKSGIEQFKLGDSIILTAHLETYYFHLVASNPDNTLEGMLKYFALESLAELSAVRFNESVDLNLLVQNTFSALHIIPQEVSALPEIQ